MTTGGSPAGGRTVSSLVGIGLLAALLWSPNTLAQNIYIERPFPIFLRRPVIDLQMSYQMIDEDYASETKRNAVDKTTRLIALKTSTDGFVYHPALVTFSATLRPTFGRSTYESLGSGSGTESEGFGYDISTHWLREKPYAIALNASKSRTEVNNSAQQPMFVDRETKSAQMGLSAAGISSTLRYVDTNSSTWGYYSYDQFDRYVQSASQRYTEKSRMNLLLEGRTQGRGTEGRTTSVGERKLANLNYQYELRENAQLNTSARFHQSSSSSFDHSGQQVSSQLSMEHPFGFRSSWGLFVSEAQTASTDNRNRGHSATLSHQLYENLTTSINLSESTATDQSGSLESSAQNLSLAYTRRIPWGHLNLSFGHVRKFEDDNRTGDFEQILDESHTFTNTTTILLDNYNVDPESIRVTDEVGLVEYQQGLDYWIESVGNTIIITRDPLAGIADDSTILVSYIFVRTLPTERQQDRRSYSASIRFGSWLTLAASGHSRNDSVADWGPQLQLQDSRSRSYSAALSLGKSRTLFDYRKHTDTNFSFVQRSVRQTWATRMSPRLAIDFGVFWRSSLLSNQPDWQTNYGLNTSANITGKRNNTLTMGYSLTRYDSFFGTEDAWGLTIDYRWKYGAWRPRISYRQNELLKEPRYFERTGKLLFFYVDRTFR